MPIRGEGLLDGDEEQQQQADGEGDEVTYVLHPNCGIFEEP